MHVYEDIRRYNTSRGGTEQVLQVFPLIKNASVRLPRNWSGSTDAFDIYR